MLDFRSALRSTLAVLTETGYLRCEYRSASADFCDAENVLLYNVGMSSFGRLITRRLTFERSFAPPPPCGQQLARPAAHYQRYTTSAKTGFSHWGVTDVIAQGEARLPDRRDRVGDWWSALVTGDQDWSGEAIVGESFGLTLSVPGRGRSVATAVKPMLDGVISGLHHDPSPPTEAVARVANGVGLLQEQVHRQLTARQSPLGPRSLVRLFRQGVQWNPADDLCTACSVEQGSPDASKGLFGFQRGVTLASRAQFGRPA